LSKVAESEAAVLFPTYQWGKPQLSRLVGRECGVPPSGMQISRRKDPAQRESLGTEEKTS